MSVLEPIPPVLEQASRGHRSMLLSQGVRIACKVLAVFLLARLVSPAEHGLFAMASSVILLLALFRDAGLGAAAIRAHRLDDVQLNTLFWAHLLLGALLALVTMGLAQPAAHFYANPAVEPLLMTMAGAFLLIGAGGFARAQLDRAVRFKEVSWLEGLAAFTGTLCMIAAAIVGAGAYSFAAYLLVSEAVAVVLAWRVLPWRPSAGPRWTSLRGLLRTGVDVTSYQVIGHLVQQIDGIVVGRLFGAHALGLYNRANQLLALPQLHLATPLNQVAMATLARLGLESRDFLDHARRTATAIAHLVLPLFAICTLLPEDVVRLVLGAQWPDAAPLLRLLAVAAAAATLTSLAYAINVAAGQTPRLVMAAIVALPLTAVAVWLGSRHGVIGVATSIAFVNVVLVVPRLWWSLRELPGGFRSYADALRGPFVATAAFSLGLWLGRVGAASAPWAWRLALASVAGMIALLVTAAVWPRLRSEWQLVRTYLPLPWVRHP